MRKLTKSEVRIFLVITIIVYSILIPTMLYLENTVDRPVCAASPEADLTARILTTGSIDQQYYVYLSHNHEPIISRTPLNLTEPEWYFVPVEGGGITDLCIRTAKP